MRMHGEEGAGLRNVLLRSFHVLSSRSPSRAPVACLGQDANQWAVVFDGQGRLGRGGAGGGAGRKARGRRRGGRVWERRRTQGVRRARDGGQGKRLEDAAKGSGHEEQQSQDRAQHGGRSVVRAWLAFSVSGSGRWGTDGLISLFSFRRRATVALGRHGPQPPTPSTPHKIVNPPGAAETPPERVQGVKNRHAAASTFSLLARTAAG